MKKREKMFSQLQHQSLYLKTPEIIQIRKKDLKNQNQNQKEKEKQTKLAMRILRKRNQKVLNKDK